MIPLLEFHDVSAGYGMARVLHGVSFAINPGERVSILGRNGVGKSTVVNTLVAKAKLMGGTIVIDGKRPSPLQHFSAAQCGVAVVQQGRGIIPNLTVEENLLLGKATRRQGRWDLAQIYALYPVLKERAKKPGIEMSGGQQQMLAIGRALMSNPSLLILDEPSEGLAPVVIDELASTLNSLGEETSLLLVEQNIHLVKRVAQRYCVLSKGRLVEEGTLADLSLDDLRKHIAL